MSGALTVASCMLLAAQTYQVPAEILLGILQVEGGKIGQEVRNTNGSYDLGPMQINTIWLPELAKIWNVDKAKAKRWVRDDACTNIKVSAWILKQHYRETRDYHKAVRYYHSRTPKFGNAYYDRVVRAMSKRGHTIEESIKKQQVRATFAPFYIAD